MKSIWLPILIIAALFAVYFFGVWLVLAHVASLSVAAETKMSGRLWFYDWAGFLWGAYIGASLVQVFFGGRPLAYGRWDLSRSREPKTFIGIAMSVVVPTGVGIFFANMAVNYGIHHP